MKNFINRHKDNVLLAALSAATVVGLGAAIVFGPASNGPESVDQCNDSITPKYTTSGQLYGDFNNDGTLSGDECDWK